MVYVETAKTVRRVQSDFLVHSDDSWSNPSGGLHSNLSSLLAKSTSVCYQKIPRIVIFQERRFIKKNREK